MPGTSFREGRYPIVADLIAAVEEQGVAESAGDGTITHSDVGQPMGSLINEFRQTLLDHERVRQQLEAEWGDFANNFRPTIVEPPPPPLDAPRSVASPAGKKGKAGSK